MYYEGIYKCMEKNVGVDLWKLSFFNVYIVLIIMVMYFIEFVSDGFVKLNFMISWGSFVIGDWRYLMDWFKGVVSL